MSTSIIPGPNVFRAVSGSLFSSPVNWSRGVVPTGSDVAMIADNCTIDISRTIGSLVVKAPFTASINTGLTLNISQSINVMGHLSCSGNPSINILSRNNQINGMSPGSSTVSFIAASQQQVPGVTYNNIITSGGSSKNLTGNATISGSLILNANADLECSSYNLIVSGTVSVQNGGIRKSGYGNLTFNSLFAGIQENTRNKINFSGNPDVEFKGGFTRANYDWLGGFDSGYGTWTLSTNNQIFNPCGFTGYPITFNARLLINDVLVTMNNSQGMTMMGKIDGTTANSKLTLQERLNFGSAEIAPMSTSGTFDYTSSVNAILHYANPQNVTLPYTYYTNVWVSNSIKSLRANTSVSGALYIYGNGTSTSGIECAGHNLIVTGSTTWVGKLSKSGSGNIIFIGSVVNDTQAPWLSMDFSGGNPDIEFRNGFSVTGIYGFSFGGADNLRTGNGSFIFSTNNQSILWYATYSPKYFDAKIVVSGSITASYTNYNNGQPIVLNNTINGTQVSSKFINTATSVLYLGTPSALSGSFLTGTFDFSTPGNTVHLYGNYNATSSATLSNLYNLAISGTGTKTLGTSSYVSGALTINSSAILELSNSDLFVSGTTTGTSATLSKSGSGKITFGGFASFINGNTLNFTGHPTVEFQNGIFAQKNNAGFQYLGTGSFIFSTRNQTLALANGDNNFVVSIINKLIVSGAISVTASAPCSLMINDTITGTDPASIFKLGPFSLYINTTSSIMPTGSLDRSDSGSTIGFTYDNIAVPNYNIPYTNFSGSLILGGQYTTKSLSGDTYVGGLLNGGFAANSGIIATLECGNYNLFVSGAVNSSTKFFKSGLGYITFNGNVTMNNGNSLSLTGNPTVEFRNSFYILLNNTGFWNTGTGSFVFTTNPNQTLFLSYNGSYTIQNPIVISGSVNLVYNGSTGVIHSGVFNGTDANSKLTISNNQIVYYNASQQPMLTGSIDFSSSLNTFIYNSGSQNVKGGTYRNLTFLNGLKTLQGNVSVLGTFSTGSGATSGSFNLNGFTLTNP